MDTRDESAIPNIDGTGDQSQRRVTRSGNIPTSSTRTKRKNPGKSLRAYFYPADGAFNGDPRLENLRKLIRADQSLGDDCIAADLIGAPLCTVRSILQQPGALPFHQASTAAVERYPRNGTHLLAAVIAKLESTLKTIQNKGKNGKRGMGELAHIGAYFTALD